MNKTRLTKLPTNTEVTPDPAKEKEEKEKSEKAKESKNFTKKFSKLDKKKFTQEPSHPKIEKIRE